MYFCPRNRQPGLFPGGLLETGESILQRLLLGECEQEGQGGFGALILAQAVDVQAIPTATGGGIVEREPQVVPAEKPFERAAGFGDPGGVSRGVVGLDAGGNGG